MFLLSSKKKLLSQACVLAAPLILVGCSSVPDAVNPAEWYRSSVELFSDDETETPENAKKEEAKAEEGSEAAPAPEAVAEKPKEIPSGFVAAQQPQRQYAQPVMRQGEIVNALGDAPATVASNQPPAPAAAPTTPVQSNTIATSPAPTTQPTPVIAQSQPASQPAAPAVNQAVQQRATGVARDNRSVSEIFAANVAQTRPVAPATTLRGADTITLGGHSFDTVVVSSGGVTRQAAAQPYQPQRFASASQVVQSDARTQLSTAMAIEPAIVQQGQAISLSRHNASLYTGTFQVATIQFGVGSANLTGEDRRILQEVVNIHRQQGGVIRVVGHASSRTRDMSPDDHIRVNREVAVGRADKVGREFLRLGVTANNLFVGGVSDSQPLYQEVMPSGEAGNRRTEIFIDY